MNKLLAIEWLKLKRYRTFWIMMGLFALLQPLWNYVVVNGLIKLGGGAKGGINLLSTSYSFPNVWGNLGFWGSYFIWFLAILVIIITTNEYTYRTQRQNVIDGLSRMQFYHAKVLMVILLSAVATVHMFITGAAFGFIISGSFHGLLMEIENVGYFFVLSLDYLGFALLLSLLIKRSGLAIGMFMLYNMIIENIARAILERLTDGPSGTFLPCQSADELLPFQLTQMAKAFMPSSAVSNSSYVIAALCWCVVYYIAGRMLLARSDW